MLLASSYSYPYAHFCLPSPTPGTFHCLTYLLLATVLRTPVRIQLAWLLPHSQIYLFIFIVPY